MYAMEDKYPKIISNPKAKMFFELDSFYSDPYRYNKKYKTCKDESWDRGQNFKVIPPKPNEVRVTVLGDSVTGGCWAFPYGSRFGIDYNAMQSNTDDGSYWLGYGFIYKLR